MEDHFFKAHGRMPRNSVPSELVTGDTIVMESILSPYRLDVVRKLSNVPPSVVETLFEEVVEQVLTRWWGGFGGKRTRPGVLYGAVVTQQLEMSDEVSGELALKVMGKAIFTIVRPEVTVTNTDGEALVGLKVTCGWGQRVAA